MNILKMELHRAFLNKRFLIALLCGIAIAGLHVGFSVIPDSFEQSMYIQLTGYPLSVFNRWLGGWPGTVFPSLYFFLLPLFVCIPYSDSLYEDRTTGWIAHIISRGSSFSYYASKFLVAFLIGAIVSTIPLLIDFLLTSLFLPFIQPNAASGLFPIFPFSMWSTLYYDNAFIYNICFLGLIAVTSGLLACIPLVFSRIIENRIIVTCSALFICTILAYLFGSGTTAWLSPSTFMRPDQPIWGYDYGLIIIFLLILAALEIIFLFRLWRTNEAL
jgi:hypothetical protein